MTGQQLRINTRVLSPAVYQELENFGLFETFFPSNNLTTMLSVDVDDEKELDQDATCHFIAFRSKTRNNSTYMINWDHSNNGTPFLKSGDTIDNMVAIDSSNNDLSKIKILKKGWYRIMMRVVSSISSSYYVRLLINGGVKKYCYQSNNGTTYDKTFYMNDIIEFQVNDYFQFHSNIKTKANCELGSYLCIECLPAATVNELGIWQSSATNGHYRQLNTAVKTNNDLYEFQSNQTRLTVKVKFITR